MYCVVTYFYLNNITGIKESEASEKVKTDESDFESDGSLLSLGIQSPRREAEISPSKDKSPVQSPAQKEPAFQSEIKIDEEVDQSDVMKERSLSQSQSLAGSVDDESIVDDLLESAYQENVTQQQVSYMPL